MDGNRVNQELLAYFGHPITVNGVYLNRMSLNNSLAVLCGAAALAFVGSVAVSRVYVQHRAKELITDIQGLDEALNPTAATISFTKKYQRYLVETTCDRGLCQSRFVFRNRVLSIPRLAKPAEIEVFVSLFHERLDEVMVRFTSNVFRENSPTLLIAEAFCHDRTDIPCTDFAINPHGRGVQTTWNGDIFIGQLAREDQKRSAWAFNFDCLVAHEGCRDISELNPQIWKRTSPDTVSSRLRSTADSIAEAAQPLPD